MKHFFDGNKKLVTMIILIIILFPILILCPSPIGIIPRDIGTAIVGYGGAILGGFLTLYGVWWTIEDNNGNRKKELELQYCPILTADIVEPTMKIHQLCSEIIVLYQHSYFDDANLKYAKSLIKITNVGRGEIKRTSLKLDSCRVMATLPHELSEGLNLDASYILCDGIFNFIPINGAFYLYVGVPTLKGEYYPKLSSNAFARLEISLNIIIEGAFSSEEQNYRLHFCMNVPLKNDWKDIEIDCVTFMRESSG